MAGNAFSGSRLRFRAPRLLCRHQEGNGRAENVIFSRSALVFSALLAFATPASAFDCTKASTPVEKTICGDATAKEANDRMESAYFTLRDQLKGTGSEKTLQDGQRAWLKYRDDRCGPVAQCLGDESGLRAEALGSTPPGMVAFFNRQPGKPGSYEIKLSGHRFADMSLAGASAFNDAVDAALAPAPFNDTDVEAGRTYEFETTVNVARLGNNLASAVAYTYTYSGGAHPNSSSQAINIDRRTGGIAEPLTLFGEGISQLKENCIRQILEAKQEFYGNPDDPKARAQLEKGYPGVVAEHITASDRWHFGPEVGIVTFDSYSIGSYAEGPFECQFGYDMLREFAADQSIFD